MTPFFVSIQQRLCTGFSFRFILLFILFTWSTITALQAQTTTWTGAVDTDWYTPGNWSAGVPTTTLDAVIAFIYINGPVLSTTAVAKSVEVQYGGSLSITTGGSLSITGSRYFPGFSEETAFYNVGTVNNRGQLIIGNTASNKWYGLYNVGTFTNNPEGVITVDQTSNTGLTNSGSFTNAGQINIGATASVGSVGLTSWGTFLNTTGGVITIDRSTFCGILNTSGNFTNEAQIIIGAKAPVENYGVYNHFQSTFNNKGCGALLNIVSNAIIYNVGNVSFTNSGTIIENASGDSNIASNSGLVRNLNGGSFTVTTNTGVITTAPGGAGTSITASPSLTITQGQSATLTASGATSYTWSTGETTPAISVSVAGTYSVTGTLGSCISTTSVTLTLTPDLAPILYARPTTLYNTTDVSVVVDVVELTGLPTSGPLTVRLTKDARLNLTYPPTATQINNRSVQNNSWTLSDSFWGYYTLTTNQPVTGGDKLSFGFIGNLVPGATSGSLTVSAVIVGGSGGESRGNNNTDSDKMDYFQQ